MAMFEEYKRVRQISEKPGGERNLFDFLIYRRLSTWLLLFLKDTGLTPNMVTALSVMFSLVAAFFLFRADDYAMILTGTFFLNVSLVFDTLDGQLSRYKKLSSEFGAWYDQFSDIIKYIILFTALSLGLYYHNPVNTQWILKNSACFTQTRELPLILGLLIISNLFMIYFIHVTRHRLPHSPKNVLNVPDGTDNQRFFIGVESTLYTIFTVFLLCNQPYGLFAFLVLFLPCMWIYPFILILKQSQMKSEDI